MKCLILAAGYATRLYPLTENYPKPLLDVNGKTILDYLIEDLEEGNNLDQYIIVSNHKFYSIFKKWNTYDKVTVIDDGSTNNDNRLGAVKDIKYALDYLDVDDDLLVIAGDNLLDFSLNDFIDYSKEKNSTCVMRYELNDINKLKRTGVLEVDENDRVISMEEKPQEPKSNMACPPFYYYQKEDIGLINEALYEGISHDAPGSFIQWLCRRKDVYAFLMPGKRYDIGNLESYEEAKRLYKGVKYENKNRFKK